jgi:predicted DNA-binding ribbon-helix-helix protein
MLYIVRRTQLYLEEDLWSALHERARQQGTTISDLVRKAAREQYMSLDEDRRAAME